MDQSNQTYKPHSGLYDNRPVWLGIEIWQLLTILTVVFTILSGSLWYQTIRPSSIRDSFKLIDRSKSTTVETVTFALDNIDTRDMMPELGDTDITQACFPSIHSSAVDYEEYNFIQDTVYTKKKDISLSIEELSNESNTDGLRVYTELGNSAVDLIQAVLDHRTAQSNYQAQLHEYRKAYSRLCLSDALNIEFDLQQYQKVASAFFDQYPSETSLKQANQKLISEIYLWVEKNNSPNTNLVSNELPRESLDTFEKELLSEAVDDYIVFDMNQESVTDYNGALVTLEIWQREYANRHKNLNLYSDIILFT